MKITALACRLTCAVVVLVAPAASRGTLQGQAVPSTGAATRTPTQRSAPRPPVVAISSKRASADAQGSISQRLFDAPWVLFPARLALAIVFLTAAILLLIGGSWTAARLAHSLRHLDWKQPPRRLKRGEVGAAGTTLAVEWEERLSTNIENDEERDRQIASLREVVERLTLDHNEIAAALAAIGKSGGGHPDE